MMLKRKRPPVMPLPDLSRHRSATQGFDYVVTLDSGRPGPHALITALVHGNEVASAIGLERLVQELQQPGQGPVAGKVSACFANYRAYELYNPTKPFAGRFLQADMNRLWTDDLRIQPQSSWEMIRAQELRPLVEDCDFLLDLHTMPRPAPPLALIGPEARHRDLARAMGWPRYLLTDQGHTSGPRLTDYKHFRGSDGFASAILVECGGHQEPSSADHAEEACHRFLAALHMLDRPNAKAETPPIEIEVTHTIEAETEGFKFAREFDGLTEITPAGTLIARDGQREIRTPYRNCILLMPSLLPVPDSTAIRFGRPLAGR